MNRIEQPTGQKPWLTWIVGVLGIALALYGISFGVSEQARYEQKANDAAAKYASHSAEQSYRPCNVLTGKQQLDCRSNAKTEQELKRRDNRREYDDLVAQQRSALWTSIMGVAAITGMIISVVGVALVYATFRETRRTADEARRSADAFIANEQGWPRFTHGASRMKDDPHKATIDLRVEVLGKAPIEITGIHWGILKDAGFPRNFAWTVRGANFPHIGPRSDKNIPYPLTTLVVPAEPSYLGGWVAYRTQFPGEMKSFFLFELGEFPDRNGVQIFRAKLAERKGWPG